MSIPMMIKAELDKRKNTVPKVLKKEAKKLERQAKAGASWTDRTGNTRRSIKGTSKGMTITLGHYSDVGLYHEKGTGIYGPKGRPITPKKGKYLVFTGKDGNNFNTDSHMTTIINNLNGKFVKIGTEASTNSGTVKISGEVWATNGFYEKSDKRLKENIKSINEPLDKILSIPTVKFNFKDNDELKVGTIAQEVESIFPELVTEDERGIKAVDYSKLSIVAIAAIKELVNKVNDLEDKINKLT